MTEKELDQYLKDNLKVKIYTTEKYTPYGDYTKTIHVDLLLHDKVISSSEETIENQPYEEA